jgi:hypothetical protein
MVARNFITVPGEAFTASGTGAVERTVDDKLRDVVSVKDFGAVGDGVTDDTTAIQTALDYIASKSVSSIGGTIFVPSGRYLIKAPLGISVGTTIEGETSGLVGINPNPNTGTTFVVSSTTSGGSTWSTSTLNPGNTVSGRVLFYMKGGGGVVTMRNFGAIPDNSVTSNAVFFFTGQQSGAYLNQGVTQGFFETLRPTAFNTVFSTSKFNDTNFVNCGFEFNQTVFSVNAKTDGSSGEFTDARFVNCTFFGYLNGFTIGASEARNISFAACHMLGSVGVNVNAFLNVGLDTTVVKNWTLASCVLDNSSAPGGNKNTIAISTEDPSIEQILFSGCVLRESGIYLNYHAPGQDVDILNCTGCVFEDSSIVIDRELDGLNVSSCSFIGNSYVSATGLVNSSFTDNSFLGSTSSQPYDIDLGTSSNFLVNGNKFRTNKGVNIAVGNANYKAAANLNVPDGAAVAWVMFDGTTGAIQKAFNVLSVQRNGTGNYTINFKNALPDANYAAALSARSSNPAKDCVIQEAYNVPIRSTTQLKIFTVDGTFSSLDADKVSCIIYC